MPSYGPQFNEMFSRGFGAQRQQNVFGGGATQTGLRSLFEMLQRGGRTDPTALNMRLSDVDRQTQQGQDATQAMAARSGLGGSGVFQAMGAAQGVGGAAQKLGLRAEDRQRMEQSRLMNLQLLRDLVIGPGVERYGIDQGINMQNAQSRDAMFNSLLAALGTGVGGYLQSK